TLRDNWKITVTKLSQQMNLGQLTVDQPGSVDQVAGQPVVLGPQSKSYYVLLAPTVLGGLYPANRQQLARWIGFARQNQNIVISPYLMEAAALVGPNANQVVMACDLSYVLDPVGVNARLRNCRALAGQQVDFDALTKLITGLRGVTITLKVGYSIEGQLRA